MEDQTYRLLKDIKANEDMIISTKASSGGGEICQNDQGRHTLSDDIVG